MEDNDHWLDTHVAKRQRRIQRVDPRITKGMLLDDIFAVDVQDALHQSIHVKPRMSLADLDALGNADARKVAAATVDPFSVVSLRDFTAQVRACRGNAPPLWFHHIDSGALPTALARSMLLRRARISLGSVNRAIQSANPDGSIAQRLFYHSAKGLRKAPHWELGVDLPAAPVRQADSGHVKMQDVIAATQLLTGGIFSHAVYVSETETFVLCFEEQSKLNFHLCIVGHLGQPDQATLNQTVAGVPHLGCHVTERSSLYRDASAIAVSLGGVDAALLDAQLNAQFVYVAAAFAPMSPYRIQSNNAEEGV